MEVKSNELPNFNDYSTVKSKYNSPRDENRLPTLLENETDQLFLGQN